MKRSKIAKKPTKSMPINSQIVAEGASVVVVCERGRPPVLCAGPILPKQCSPRAQSRSCTGATAMGAVCSVRKVVMFWGDGVYTKLHIHSSTAGWWIQLWELCVFVHDHACTQFNHLPMARRDRQIQMQVGYCFGKGRSWSFPNNPYLQLKILVMALCSRWLFRTEKSEN